MIKVADQWLRDILVLFAQLRTATRADILKATGLNPASVSHALQHLIRAGLVVKIGERDSGGKRKQEILNLNADTAFLIAIDLEGSSIRFALTNLVGDIRCRWEEDIEFGQRLELSKILGGIDRVLACLDTRQRERVICIGISHPGFPDRCGHITAVNLGWDDFPLGEQLERALKLPVFFEDAHHTYVQAERWLGVAQDSDNFAYLIVGHGIGVGCFVDGHLLEGGEGVAGEIGHIAVDPQAADRCNCGRRGCVEAIASSPNMVRQFLHKNPGARTAGSFPITSLFAAARRKDAAAIEVIDRASWHLGKALSHLVHFLNPELIVLGGDLIQGQDLFLPRIRAILTETLLPKHRERLHLMVSSLGLDIGLKGAASMAFQRCMRDSQLLQEKLCSPVGVSPARKIKRKPKRSVVSG
jgi:predicted NBD/HSP70 family sugar kinase